MEIKKLSPIVIFVYNRPEHTAKTIESLQNNYLSEDTELFIYSDAPRQDIDYEKVIAVRSYIRNIKGFKTINIVEADRNKGLADSIVNGVTEIIEHFGKAIVLEDDLITSRYFIINMNNALNFYDGNYQIWSISGYTPSFDEQGVSQDYYFNEIACSWGWATWKNRWDKINWDLDTYDFNSDMAKSFKKLGRQFPLMLELQKRRLIDSWAIRWNYNCHLNGTTNIYFSKTLIVNIGHDGSGTNCSLQINNQANTSMLSNKIHVLSNDVGKSTSIVKLLKKEKQFIFVIKHILLKFQVYTFIKNLKNKFR